MSDSLVVQQPEASALTLPELVVQAEDYLRESRAASTIRSYRSDWQDFEAFCRQHGVTALPSTPVTIVLYLTDRADTLKVSTLQRRVVAISQVHQAAGHDEPPTQHPTVRKLLKGIRRNKGVAQDSKAATLTDDIREMVDSLPDNLLGVRDRALLLVGFAGALRRSELTGLDVDDLAFNREGLVLTIRRSKTDQEGAGAKIGIAYGSDVRTCPVRSLQSWLDKSGIADGPVFRNVDRHGKVSPRRLTSEVVALVVQRTMERLGKDASAYGGHSLRSGFATQAALADVSERDIARQTRHRSMTVLRRYIKEGSLWRQNPSARLGL